MSYAHVIKSHNGDEHQSFSYLKEFFRKVVLVPFPFWRECTQMFSSLSGKRQRQSVAASGCTSSTSCLFVTDQNTKKQFLIDTGSHLCCFPKGFLSTRHSATSFQLNAAINSSIKTYGFIMLNLVFGIRHTFKWRFIVAGVSTPIIGADFLAHFNLLPDCRNKRLINNANGVSIAGSLLHTMQCSIKTIVINHAYSDILSEFPALTRPQSWPRPITHETVHHIRMTPGPPLYCHPCRFSSGKAADRKRRI